MRRDERGVMAIEVVILTPALVAAIMVIAAGARFVDAEVRPTALRTPLPARPP